MTRAFKVYQGEDQTPVFDYTDSVIWEDVEMGSHAWLGEGSLSSATIRDPNGEIGNADNLPAGLSYKALPARNVAEWTEDTTVMGRWRVSTKEFSRGEQRASRYRQGAIQFEDANQDLDGIPLINVSRPAETDVARLQYFAGAYLAGNFRATTNLDATTYVNTGSNTVLLPAQVYNQTTLRDVLREITTTANKQFFVMPRFTTGQSTTGYLFYDGNDSTAFASSFFITDREDELRANPTTALSIVWDAGSPVTDDGQQLISGAYMFYGSGDTQYVYSHDTRAENSYSKFEEVIFDDAVTDATTAARRVAAIVSRRNEESHTYAMSLRQWDGTPLTQSQAAQLHAGQLIQVKARVIPGADDQFVSRRIVDLRWRTPAPGYFIPYVVLEQPISFYGGGVPLAPKPPTNGGPPSTVSFESGGVTDFDGSTSNKISNVAVTGASNGMLLVFIALGSDTAGLNKHPDHVYWQTDQTTSSDTSHPMTQIGSTVTVGKIYLTAWKLDAPAASVSQTGTQRGKVWFTWTQSGGTPLNEGYLGVAHYITGMTSFTTLSATATSATGSVSNSLSGTSSGYLVIDGAAVSTSNSPFSSAPVAGTPDSGQTQDWAVGGAGTNSVGLGSSHKTATGSSTTMGWTGWGTTGGYFSGVAQIIVGLPGTLSSGTITIGGPGSGTTGPGGTYVPGGTVVEHGDLSGTGGTMHDGSQISLTDSSNYFTTDNVEAALRDLAAGVTGPLTTLGDMLYRGANGSNTRLAIGASNTHLVSDGTRPLWTAQTGASGGVSGTVLDHGAMGATETFDVSAATWHVGTLNANVTVTLTGATSGTESAMLVELVQDGTGGRTLTLPSSVVEKTALEAAYPTTASTTTFLTLFTRDGGTTWHGGFFNATGSSSSSSSSVPNVHDESLTDGASNFIFAGGDIVTVVGVPNPVW